MTHERPSREIARKCRCLHAASSSGWSLVVCVLVTVTVDETHQHSHAAMINLIQSSFSSANRPNHPTHQFDVFVCLCMRLCVCWFPLCCVQVASALGEPRLPLDLKHRLNYTVQVRSSSLDNPPLWSDWSERHHIYLDSKNRFLSNAKIRTRWYFCSFYSYFFFSPDKLKGFFFQLFLFSVM